MVKRKILILLVYLSVLLQADIYEKGKYNIGITAGYGSTFSGNYTLVGVGGNYFFMDNLSVGAAYRGWFGVDPMRNEISLSANYFIPLHQRIRPYVGAFARETFVSGYDDYTSFGARGGISVISENSYVSIGYAYEKYTNCLFGECSTSYPELVFGLSF